MAKCVYWTVSNAVANYVYESPTDYFDETKKPIGYYSASIVASFKQDLSDDATQPETTVITDYNSAGVECELEFVYNASVGGYQIYKLTNKSTGKTTEYMYHTSVMDYYESRDDRMITGIYTANTVAGTTTVDGGSNPSGEVTSTLEASSGYVVDLETIMDFDGTWSEETQGEEFFSIANILGIFGIPYQFMPHVDPRLRYKNNGSIVAGTSTYITDTQGTGIEYADHIASHMPILFLSPGLPNFMTKFSTAEKKSILDYFASTVAGIAGNISPDDLLKDSGKYYTFEYAITDYYSYVNPMCRIAAAYLNLTGYTWDNKSMDSVNWMEYTMARLDGIFQGRTDITDYMAVPFYIESETQINETFSNDTTESTLASTVDSISNFGKEAMFMLGYSQAALGTKILEVDADMASQYSNISDLLGPLATNNGFVGNIIKNLSSVVTGGRLVFPKIWNDSSFSRSYDVTIKLRSPDMDNLSIYLNVIVPFLHLLGFVLPRQINGNPNGFFSPFLVRAIYKGFFNVDMGLVTNMSVTKGDTAQWNANGIPTSIDVNLTIADLYENISMTPTTALNWKYDTLDNTCQMDYIATMFGINIYQPEIGRTIRMWFVNNFTNRARDVIDIGFWGNLQNSIANAITNVWRGKSL